MIQATTLEELPVGHPNRPYESQGQLMRAMTPDFSRGVFTPNVARDWVRQALRLPRDHAQGRMPTHLLVTRDSFHDEGAPSTLYCGHVVWPGVNVLEVIAWLNPGFLPSCTRGRVSSYVEIQACYSFLGDIMQQIKEPFGLYY